MHAFVIAFFSVVTLALFLPLYLLTEGLVSLSALWHGVQYSAFGHWTEPELWVPPLLTMLTFIGLWIFLPWSQRNVIWFEFDADSRTLNFLERYRGRTRLHTVAFDAICSVRPILMQTYATDGHLQVVVNERRHAPTRQFGSQIAIATLRECAQWLKIHLDERVEPTLQLDL